MVGAKVTAVFIRYAPLELLLVYVQFGAITASEDAASSDELPRLVRWKYSAFGKFVVSVPVSRKGNAL